MKIKTAVSQTNNIMVKVALIIYYSLISREQKALP